MPRLGLYVHIPFCLSKCAYCDFVSYAGRADTFDDYVDAVLAEIESFEVPIAQVSTVYFGGGTPTLLGAERLTRVLAAIQQRFAVVPDAEITCEANPETITEDLLAALRQAGFNRLSIGVQSLDDDVLSVLGRSHDSATARRAVTLAREHFDNLGIDLIFGTPGESAGSWRETLTQAVDLEPDHISSYCLTVEEGTPLAESISAGEMAPPDEDLAADMMSLTGTELVAAGYEHYEISNFAREGKRCAHNVDCWQCRDYVGFGAAAHSKLAGRRAANSAELEHYIGATLHHPQQLWSQKLSALDEASEATILGLRLLEGMSTDRLREIWRSAGIDVSASLDRLAGDGLLHVGERVRMTKRGLPLANAIFRAFV